MRATDLSACATDPVGFIDRFIKRNEKGRPWSLSQYQRRVLALAFRWGPTGTLLFRILLWSEIKKSGKTFLAACLVIWWGFVTGNTEIICAANDLDQSVGRVFRTIVALLRFNPELEKSATIRATEIIFSNGTTIVAIPSDYKGAAGSRHSLVVFDELWGYTQESAQRLYEELTPPPTEPDAWVLIVTTAGWTGESVLLEALYNRGLTGERLDEDLEVYAADGLFMFWSHTPRQPWLTSEYYAEQQRILRSGTFDRLHRNRWAVAEAKLFTPELWDGCIEPSWSPAEDDPDLPVWLGGDVGVVSDYTAVSVVTVDPQDDLIVLVDHRIWRPSKMDPIDLESTLEAYIRNIARRFRLIAGYLDPYQAHRSLMTLQRAGLPVRGFPQTEGNTTRMGEMLYSLLRSRRLVLYPDADLRQQAMNTVGVEGTRGVRIAKASASRKVDAIVSLSMACLGALDVPVRAPLQIVF